MMTRTAKTRLKTKLKTARVTTKETAQVKTKAGTLRRAGVPEEVTEPDADNGRDRIVARPDGYHWLTPDGKQEFGPFETVELAREDMDAADERALAPAITLSEAEREIGIAEWLDPETGEPAEGPSPPCPEEE
jgi:hypothetical protein